MNKIAFLSSRATSDKSLEDSNESLCLPPTHTHRISVEEEYRSQYLRQFLKWSYDDISNVSTPLFWREYFSANLYVLSLYKATEFACFLMVLLESSLN